MKNDVAISVNDVTKDFHLPKHKSDSLKQTITQVFKPKEKGVDVHHALKGISFEVKKGEFFGVLGRNGSGKSTLLKIISEIYKPTSGTVEHNGTLVSFIELGVGFKAELSGRENVFLNGALLGFSKNEIEDMYDDIVGFAELEKFMDQKLKNYSSGMKVRLAFSVAIRAKADILILDEVLAVGDAAFQKKCYDYFDSLKDDTSKTIVFVTHNMSAVRKYCSKAVVIDDGLVQFEGDADSAADKYLSLFADAKTSSSEKVTNEELSGVRLDNISILQMDKTVKNVEFKKDFSVRLDVFSEKTYDDISMGMYFYDQKGRDIVVVSSKMFGKMSLIKGKNVIILDIQNIFTDGEYYINFAIENNRDKKLLVQKHKISPFSVVGLSDTGYSKRSLVHPNIEVRYE